MAYTGKDKKIFIENTFPSDYENLFRIMSVKDNHVELNIKSFFEVHPEYDIPYKLNCMILSSNFKNWLPSIQKMFDKNSPMEYKLTQKGKIHWKDYMFQIPGIYKMLGIQRGYVVEEIEKTLQKPLFFLYLAYIRLGCLEVQKRLSVKLRETVLDLVEIALDAYEQKKESNEFAHDQLEMCSRFLFDYSLNEDVTVDWGIYEPQEVGKWSLESAAEKNCNYEIIELRLERVMETYVENMQEAEKIDRDNAWDKGTAISYPKFIRPILAGLYLYQGELPFASYEDKPHNNTFWSNRDIPVFSGVDAKTEGVFYDLVLYIVHKQIMREHAISIMSCRQIEEVDRYLKKYYTFCMGTLNFVFLEKEKNKDAARDSFERLFSLYLFKEETDLLYQKVSSFADGLMKELSEGDSSDSIDYKRAEVELKLAKCMADFFSSDVLHEIFCSPGIYHRVLLARFINTISISEEEIMAAYVLYENGDTRYCSADGLQDEVRIINKRYQYEEYKFIRKKLFENSEEKLKYDQIKKGCGENPEEMKYEEFYNELENKEKAYRKSKDKLTKPQVKHLAENILKEGEFKSPAYRFLHFWVIMSSFLPNNFLLPELKFPDVGIKKA